MACNGHSSLHSGQISRSKTLCHIRLITTLKTREGIRVRGYFLIPLWNACVTLQWRHNERDGVSNHQPHDCLLNLLFRRRSNKASKLRVTGLRAWNSPVTGEFPAQMASNAENVSIWWRRFYFFNTVLKETNVTFVLKNCTKCEDPSAFCLLSVDIVIYLVNGRHHYWAGHDRTIQASMFVYGRKTSIQSMSVWYTAGSPGWLLQWQISLTASCMNDPYVNLFYSNHDTISMPLK